ncbi:MAG: hypothetical protein Q9165_006176 [Trypethelium subeluteriae]
MSFFGKNPNGLSINTGGGAAAGGSSLFGGTSSSQPQQQGSGLFGSSTTTSQPAQGGGLFGSTTNTSQPQQGGGLFGSSTTATQPQQGGGLFGSSTAGSQPQQGGGLFGSGTTGSQPQAGGLFGSATSQPQQSGELFGSNAASQPKQGGGLFGSSTTSQPQQNNAPSGSALFGGSSTQPQAGGGLFGAQPNQTQSQGGGLFGSLGQKQQQSQPQQSGTGLFGSLGQSQQSQPQQNTSLFGGSTFGQPQSQPQQSTSLFGNSFLGQSQPQQQQPPQPQSSAFGTLGAQGRAATASLFGSSTAQRPTQSLFPGPLTMGQSTNTAQPTSSQPGPSAPTTVPGVTIDLTQIRGTTRFNDLHSDLQTTIGKIDTFIAQQISHAEQCAQLLPSHADALSSIAPDVAFVAGRLDTAEAGIDNDTRAIRDLRDVVECDGEDAKRAFRALENLKLPERFHYPGMWASAQHHHYHARPAQPGAAAGGGGGGADPAEEVAAASDLVGYFEGVVREMEGLLERYTGNMREIEEHLRTVEQGAIRQTKELMARKGREKAGGEEGVSRKEENLRELATVLREFENGILHVAGSVGACREQVQQLMLGGTNGLGRNGFGGSIGGNGWGRLSRFARA